MEEIFKICNKCSDNKNVTDFEFQRKICKSCRMGQRKVRGRPKYPKLHTGTKTCSRCKLLKNRTEFHQYLYAIDGCQSHCNDCSNIRMKKFYEKNKESIKQNHNNYYQNLKNNPEAKSKRRATQKAYHHKLMKEDPFYKMRARLRNRLYYALRNQNWKKNTHFAKYIGCSREELISHIESQFQPGMTWNNYGKWHLDRQLPLVSAQTSEELYKLCHFTNLQPLWALDNIRKGAKL